MGGVKRAGEPGNERRVGAPIDCVQTPVVTPEDEVSTDCSCLTGAPLLDAPLWCAYTINTSGDPPTCDALAGSRYINFADNFTPRTTFDSICRSGADAFGPALEDFARIATLACFYLENVRPADDNPAHIEVKRRSRDLADEPDASFSILPRIEADATVVPEGGAWIYEPLENKVCLIGLDRLTNDEYDIVVLHDNKVDYSP